MGKAEYGVRQAGRNVVPLVRRRISCLKKGAVPKGKAVGTATVYSPRAVAYYRREEGGSRKSAGKHVFLWHGRYL